MLASTSLTGAMRRMERRGGGEERFAGSARKVTTGASERAGFGNNGLIDLGTSSDGGADHDSASLHLSQAKGLWRPTCCERTAPSCSPPNRHTAVSTVKSSISAAIVVFWQFEVV